MIAWYLAFVIHSIYVCRTVYNKCIRVFISAMLIQTKTENRFGKPVECLLSWELRKSGYRYGWDTLHAHKEVMHQVSWQGSGRIRCDEDTLFYASGEDRRGSFRVEESRRQKGWCRNDCDGQQHPQYHQCLCARQDRRFCGALRSESFDRVFCRICKLRRGEVLRYELQPVSQLFTCP